MSMKAVEVTGVVDEQGNLSLDEPVPAIAQGNVRVIILYPELAEDNQPVEDSELDPDDTPIEEIKAGLRRALQQAKSGQRIPLAQMWEGIDAE
ncbi:MAG TPA: hypothetical protein V6C88_01990 [Chroococcidiopsis sp.]